MRRIKGVEQFRAERSCLVESNFRMTLGRRNSGSENSFGGPACLG